MADNEGWIPLGATDLGSSRSVSCGSDGSITVDEWQAWEGGSAKASATYWLDLPRRIRFRFWWQRKVDGIACHLVDQGHIDAAVRLWRAFRMWSQRR